MTHDNVRKEIDRLAEVRIKRHTELQAAGSDRHIHIHRLKQLDIRIAMLKRQLPRTVPAPAPTPAP
jgi:hypothetical protein